MDDASEMMVPSAEMETVDVESTWRNRVPLVPAACLSLALMVLAQALAAVASRQGDHWADALYWLSANGMVLVVAAVQLFAAPSPRQRVGLVVALALSLYSVKVLSYPLGFTYFDELSHMQTAVDIFQSGHLFHTNSLQPISPYYPGLELATVAFANLTGLSLFISGVAIVGVSRAVLVASIYALFVEASGSQRVAGLGTVIYMANPSFLYFDAGFSYESFALPLAVVALTLTLRWARTSVGGRRRSLLACVAIVICALVVTHHLTSYLTAGLLLALCVCILLGKIWGASQRRVPWLIAAFAAAAAVAWFFAVATITFPYLRDVLQPAISGVLRVVSGDETARSAFSEAPTAATVSPFWLRTTAFGSVLLLVACLPFGALLAWRRKLNPAALLLGVLAVLYLPIQALRLTGAGVETANRSSEFIFLGVGFLVALLIVHLLEYQTLPVVEFGRFKPSLHIPLSPRALRTALPIASLVIVAILFTGSVTVFWPPYARLPGSFLAGGDVRSVSQKGLDAVHWMDTYLGPKNRVLTDRTTGQLAGAIGHQHNVEGYVEEYSVAHVLVTPSLDPVTRKILRRKKIEYLIVDTRLTKDLPARGWYFASAEKNGRPYAHPIPLSFLTKFGTLPGVSIIYNNGTIYIYDVRDLVRP